MLISYEHWQRSIFAVVPDDYNPTRTIKITPLQVVLWTSEVWLNHKIFQKFLYDVIMYILPTF